jgi:hypothetical protein
MDIGFTSAKLAELCNSEGKLRGKYGPLMAKLIQQRLGQLNAVETLEMMRGLPGHCHPLTQNLRGLFAISLAGKERLAFRPDHEPPPQLKSGGLDWSLITKIVIEGIGDYH